MIKRCKAAGVRIYADVVINHMSALSGIGSAGSQYDAPNRNFSAIPFEDDNFNDRICTSKSGTIEDDSWNDPYQV
jgi:alpha-amylase